MRHVVPEHEPLSEAVFLILTSMAEGPQHGYAIMRDIESLSGGRVRLSTGTLYGALHRLLEAGEIERFATDDTSRDKQWYRLTRTGQARLQADVNRLRSLSRAASSRLRMREA
jgi:DNA-binding PadR family transcriptional regulator